LNDVVQFCRMRRTTQSMPQDMGRAMGHQTCRWVWENTSVLGPMFMGGPVACVMRLMPYGPSSVATVGMGDCGWFVASWAFKLSYSPLARPKGMGTLPFGPGPKGRVGGIIACMALLHAHMLYITCMSACLPAHGRQTDGETNKAPAAHFPCCQTCCADDRPYDTGHALGMGGHMPWPRGLRPEAPESPRLGLRPRRFWCQSHIGTVLRPVARPPFYVQTPAELYNSPVVCWPSPMGRSLGVGPTAK